MGRNETNGDHAATGRATPRVNVAVVGAGAAGVGVGVALAKLGVTGFALLDRKGVGASFDRWPKETRFLTPSFPSNLIGPVDLNSVSPGSSPGFTLKIEHPTGAQYAAYLKQLAKFHKLPVWPAVDVRSVERRSDDFLLTTGCGPVAARFVIWAAGEFQYPLLDPFPGAEHCRSTATLGSYAELPSGSATIVGGFESALDAAVALTAAGRTVRVLAEKALWNDDDPDPSVAVSPYTRTRLEAALETGRLELIGGERVAAVEKDWLGYTLRGAAGGRWTCRNPPILAVGFHGGLSLVDEHFDLRPDGFPELTLDDESTRSPGLFVCGPAVRHDAMVFCFIYKFRQRFPVVARAVAQRLGIEDFTPLDEYRTTGMYLDDLSCCGEACEC
ncbi:MAG: NAD(P)/FAD-dependent oxidoreductase [Planctomycetia bacterium]